jgi:transketolase
MDHTPGIDQNTGSLGQGVSSAVGMAMFAKMNGKSFRTYALLGDGEIEEGLVWEASEYAAHYKLDNLCIAVDVNGLQIDGLTKDVMNMEPIDEKFASFGFNVVKCDGNDYNELERAFASFHAAKGCGKPTVILMKAVKGFGVSYMENVADWHGKGPNDAECAQALEELEAVRKKLEAEGPEVSSRAETVIEAGKEEE